MSGKAIITALSLAAAALGTMAPAHGQAVPAETAAGRDKLPGGLINPLAARPLDDLSATRERPLFSPTRRPPPPPPVIVRAPDPPPPPPEPPNVSLVGVVMDGEEARALVRFGSVNKVIHARIGDDIEGWKVAQIEGRKLVLSLDGRLATFTMFSGDRAKDAPKPTSAARPGESKGSAAQSNASQPQTQRSESPPPASRPSTQRRHRRERQ
jgi:general secretion pathway protein N